MARYRQITNPETGKSEFIPIDDAARRREHFVQGTVEDFVSPIDGTVVSGRKGIREHCEKHGVVPAQEFNQEFYDRKAEERARLHRGERTREQVLKDRQQINEIINRLERAR